MRSDTKRSHGGTENAEIKEGPHSMVSVRSVSPRLLLGPAVLAAVCASPAPAELIERILAVIDGRPVLLSEVRVLERVRGWSRPVALEALIDERLMFREATRLPQAVPTPDQEERAFQGLLEKDPGLAGAVPEADLRRLVRREATIIKYVDLRFSPQVRVGDELVQDAYEREYGGRPDAPPLAEVAPALRESLNRRALDERIEAWKSELRAGADIRYNR